MKTSAIGYDQNQIEISLRDRRLKTVLELLKEKYLGDNERSIHQLEFILNKVLFLVPNSLQNLRFLKAKFIFLDHDGSTLDDIIHDHVYDLFALCNQDPETIEGSTNILNIERIINYRDRIFLRAIGKKIEYPEEDLKILYKDVADQSKILIRKFILELNELGKILSFEESFTQANIDINSVLENNRNNSNYEIKDHKVQKKSFILGFNNECQTSLSNPDEETTGYSDNEFEEYNDSESKGASTSDDNPKSSQRSITPDVEVDSRNLEQSNDNDKTPTKDYSSSKHDTNYLLMLEKSLAWIYELPEWLQDQILNSAPVKAMIEAAEQMGAIYDHKLIEIEFANKKLEADFTFNDSDVLLTHNMYDKIEIHNTSLSNPFDLDMILEKNGVKYDILPVDMGINIASGMGNIPALVLNGVFLDMGW